MHCCGFLPWFTTNGSFINRNAPSRCCLEDHEVAAVLPQLALKVQHLAITILKAMRKFYAQRLTALSFPAGRHHFVLLLLHDAHRPRSCAWSVQAVQRHRSARRHRNAARPRAQHGAAQVEQRTPMTITIIQAAGSRHGALTMAGTLLMKAAVGRFGHARNEVRGYRRRGMARFLGKSPAQNAGAGNI